MLIDAGLVEGRSVLCHAALLNDCKAAGGVCAASRASVVPLRDGNLVTGTSWFSFPVENIEEVGRALDAAQACSRSPESLVNESLNLTLESAELGAPVVRADVWSADRSDGAVSVCALSGGFAVTGYTFSGASGTADVLVVRYNAEGAILWARALGGPGRDYGQEICSTQDDGCVVAGFTTSAGIACEDALLVRYAADGSIAWTKTFGGEEPDMALGVCATQDGGFAFCGYTMSEGAGGSDAWIVKVDGSGAVVWATALGCERNERAYAVAELESGEFAVLVSAASAMGHYDSRLVRLDSAGRQAASIPVGWGSMNVLEDFVRSGDGTTFAVGYCDSMETEAVGVLTASFAASAEQRAPIWARRAERSDAFDYGAATLELESGNLWLCGTGSEANPMRTDALFMELNRAGYVQRSVMCGATDRSERLEDACWLSAGLVVAVGHCEAPMGDQDVLVLFVDPESIP